mmetsp:Transcript_8716/g.14151  ORF Transcript_8716/g.14151 Transcript_8716/m.14151 type:complete len:427 (+) Transcript_8716:115-1395(+)
MGLCMSEDEPVHQEKSPKRKNRLDSNGGIHEQMLKSYKSAGVWHIYSRGNLLGAGMTGSVHVVTHRKTKQRFAIKSINKHKLDPAQLEELRNEVDILRQLDHPNIVRLYEVYEQGTKMYLVMQLLEGKDLGKVQFRTEREVARVMRKIISAIAYCHSKGICHRDIKLENFVFTSPDNLEDIIVIDFGIGKKMQRVNLKKGRISTTKTERKRHMQTVCGTPYYMSPQVLTGRYDEKCDCWALGVLTYILLTSNPPFTGATKSQLDHAIRKGVVHYPASMSANAKSLISSLLKFDPKKRWSCADALKSDFFKDIEKGDAKDQQLERDALERMISFQKSGRLKKLVLMVRAFNEQSDKVAKLKSTFDSLDTEHDGYISFEELQAGLNRHKIKIDAKAIFESLDVDKEGTYQHIHLTLINAYILLRTSKC